MYKAACVYGVLESPLRDRSLVGQLVEDNISLIAGPGTTLSQEDEKMLINHMEYMNSIGYGYSAGIP